MKNILSLLFLFPLQFCFAQVVEFEQLNFHSDFEQHYFQRREAGDTNHMALMLAASEKSDAADYEKALREIQGLIADLNPEKIQRYSPKKKIKKIFKAIHDELLLKYELENQFHTVFENGNYNCVSSSMLYALVLREFGIDYVITETPDHVYLVSLFENDQIVMEGTDPQKGYIRLTKKLYEEQLQQLVAQKLLTIEDINSPGLDQKLEELFPSENISLTDLVAVQYFNQAVYDYEDEDYYSSYENAKKACFLAPRFKNESMLYSSIVPLVEDHDYSDSLFPECVALAYKLDTSAANKKGVQEEIAYMIYTGIMENQEADMVENQLHLILELIADSSIAGESMFQYYLVMAGHAGKKGEIIDQYRYAGTALRSKPENQEAADQFISAFASCIVVDRISEPLDTMRKYHQDYPVLHNNNYWPSIYGELLLQEAYVKLGESYTNNVSRQLSEFETIIEQFPNSLISPDLIAQAYARQALKEFNRSKNKALSTIDRGLAYAPGHPELTRVKAMLH